MASSRFNICTIRKFQRDLFNKALVQMIWGHTRYIGHNHGFSKLVHVPPLSMETEKSLLGIHIWIVYICYQIEDHDMLVDNTYIKQTPIDQGKAYFTDGNFWGNNDPQCGFYERDKRILRIITDFRDSTSTEHPGANIIPRLIIKMHHVWRFMAMALLPSVLMHILQYC